MLSLHEVPRLKHSRNKMRKLKKELVWGVVRRYNMCACNSTFHRAVEVCLNCASVTACAASRKENMLVLL